MQIYDPNQEAKSTCGDSQSKGRGMSENTKYYKNCQLFKAELVKMNWKFSKECLFALLFIMATALYKLPYTFFFSFTLIYLTFLDRFCQNCLIIII